MNGLCKALKVKPRLIGGGDVQFSPKKKIAPREASGHVQTGNYYLGMLLQVDEEEQGRPHHTAGVCS